MRHRRRFREKRWSKCLKFKQGLWARFNDFRPTLSFARSFPVLIKISCRCRRVGRANSLLDAEEKIISDDIYIYITSFYEKREELRSVIRIKGPTGSLIRSFVERVKQIFDDPKSPSDCICVWLRRANLTERIRAVTIYKCIKLLIDKDSNTR